MANLSVRKMADALGVTKSQVGRDKQAGMPMSSVEAARAWRLADKDPSRTVDGRIDRPQASAPHNPAAEAGMAAGPGGTATMPPGSGEDEPVDQVDENTSAYRADRARNERIRADRAEIELQQLRGELVAVRDVEQLQFTAGRITRDRIEMVPARAAGELHALVLSLVPEEHRAVVAEKLQLHVFERRLADHLREALNDAAKAIDDSRRDDDEPD